MNKLYMIILLLTSLFFSSESFSKARVDIDIRPSSPGVGDSFEVIFEIETNDQGEPFMAFTPVGVDVVRKSDVSKQMSATIINGRVSSKTTYLLSYELTSDSKGVKYLKDVIVNVGDNKYPQKDIRIRVGGKRAKKANVFLLAVPEKQDVVIGEGIDVNYYLYFRSQVTSAELLEYPKYPKFHKRFRHVNDRVETVKYNGQLYRRALKYSVRLFPQKTGQLKAGSLKMKITYRDGNSNPYSFGSFLSRGKSKIIKSSPVKINVNAIPLDNLPTHFTGLIGDHDFKLTINRNKFLVNEVIEAKLEVTGVGALESYDAPKLYQNENLEEFDVKSNFSIIDAQKSKKVFEYTYLPRNPFVLPARNLSLSIYDPDTKSYVEKVIELPKLIIGGASQPSANISADQSSASSNLNNKTEKPNISTNVRTLDQKLLAPDFQLHLARGHYQVYKKSLLAVAALFMLFFMFEFRRLFSFKRTRLEQLYKKLTSKKVHYSDFHSFFNEIAKSLGVEHLSTLELISSLPINDKKKAYFKSFLTEIETQAFSNQANVKYRVRKGYFKELLKMKKNWNKNANTFES